MKKKNLKNNIIIAAITVVLIALIVIIVVNPFNISFGKKSTKSNTSNEIKNESSITEELTTKANQYYEEYFYPTIEDKDAFFPLIVDSGIILTVNNLNTMVQVEESTIIELKNNKCGLDDSKVIIYPSEPYGEKDYKVAVNLVCNQE